jgi:hypothetical protein
VDSFEYESGRDNFLLIDHLELSQSFLVSSLAGVFLLVSHPWCQSVDVCKSLPLAWFAVYHIHFPCLCIPLFCCEFKNIVFIYGQSFLFNFLYVTFSHVSLTLPLVIIIRMPTMLSSSYL